MLGYIFCLYIIIVDRIDNISYLHRSHVLWLILVVSAIVLRKEEHICRVVHAPTLAWAPLRTYRSTGTAAESVAVIATADAVVFAKADAPAR
jgi:hypothetical protein